MGAWRRFGVVGGCADHMIPALTVGYKNRWALHHLFKKKNKKKLVYRPLLRMGYNFILLQGKAPEKKCVLHWKNALLLSGLLLEKLKKKAISDGNIVTSLPETLPLIGRIQAKDNWNLHCTYVLA